MPEGTPSPYADIPAPSGGFNLADFLTNVGQAFAIMGARNPEDATRLFLSSQESQRRQGKDRQAQLAAQQQQMLMNSLSQMLQSREGPPNEPGAPGQIDPLALISQAMKGGQLGLDAAKLFNSPQFAEHARIAGRMPTAGAMQSRTIQDQMREGQNFPTPPEGMSQNVTYAPTGPTVRQVAPTSAEQLNVLAAQRGGGTTADQATRYQDTQRQNIQQGAQSAMEMLPKLVAAAQGQSGESASPGQPSASQQYTPHPTLTMTPEGKVGMSVSMNPVTDPEEIKRIGAIIQARYKLKPTDPGYSEAVGTWATALQMDPADRSKMLAALDTQHGVGGGVAVPVPVEGPLGKLDDQQLLDYAANHPDPTVRNKAALLNKKIQQQKITLAKETGAARGEAFGAGRYGHFLDSADGNRPVDLSYGDYKKAELEDPGRYLPAGIGERALVKAATYAEMHGAANDLSTAIENMPEKWTTQQAAKIAVAMRDEDSRSAWSKLVASGFKNTLTPAQVDYVTAMLGLKESAYMLRQAGSGGSTDKLRAAMDALVPDASTPSRAYAKRQVELFNVELNRLERGNPFVTLRPEAAPPVPTGTPSPTSPQTQSGFSDVQRQSALSVKSAFESGQITQQKAAKRLRDAGFSDDEAAGLLQRFQGPKR